MKVLSVVGNRPQFIKSAPLSLALRARGIDEVVAHTGQHYDPEMSQVFFQELDLGTPAYEFDLRTADAALMRVPLEDAIKRERPNWVLVYGDTNSTLAGTYAALRAETPIAHVEAGLRSGDLSMPEEMNRIEVDAQAQLLFCPDERSAQNLRDELVPGEIQIVGDVMYDAAVTLGAIARKRSSFLSQLGLEPRAYVLATIHREANVQQPRLARIVEGMRRVALPIVFPAHPRTRGALDASSTALPENVLLVEPLSYLDLAAVAQDAAVILTDSGGLQKEAYWYGVPCVTARPSTEWVDTVAVGANVLVDDDPAAIAAAVAAARMPDDRPQLYGDGRASERIVEALYTLRRA